MRPASVSAEPRAQMLVLAPAAEHVPAGFQRHRTSPTLHRRYLDGMQRLRGQIYLHDGAIRAPQLTADGRHAAIADEQSWHVLIVDDRDRVAGCARYRSHPNTVTFEELGVADSALADSPEWGEWVRDAVEAQIALARRRDVAYVEVGGWALAEHLRCTTAALRIAMATYALADLLGGCVGIGTVTARNGSACILGRLGGRALEMRGTAAPAYHDPRYGCDMTMLTFDSEQPNPRFRKWVTELRDELSTATLVSATIADTTKRIQIPLTKAA